MNNLPMAFLLGLLGSLHCAVMCGPLMLSLPVMQKHYLSTVVQLLLYQLGRVLVYTILGFMAGILGNSIILFTSQEALSLFVGVLLISFTVLHFTGRYMKPLDRIQSKLIAPISKLMGKVYGLPFWGFFAGILNGLIPCGMVYLALASALNSHSIREAGSFMFLFGLGTTPLMLTISLTGTYLRQYIRFNSSKLIPWFTLFIGALFILRSAELGIPFLSPNHNIGLNSNVTECR